LETFKKAIKKLKIKDNSLEVEFLNKDILTIDNEGNVVFKQKIKNILNS